MEQAERQKTLKAVLHYFLPRQHKVWLTLPLQPAISPRLDSEVPSQLPGRRDSREAETDTPERIARDYRIRIIALEVMPDQCHMLVEAPPRYAPAKIVQL